MEPGDIVYYEVLPLRLSSFNFCILLGLVVSKLNVILLSECSLLARTATGNVLIIWWYSFCLLKKDQYFNYIRAPYFSNSSVNFDVDSSRRSREDPLWIFLLTTDLSVYRINMPMFKEALSYQYDCIKNDCVQLTCCPFQVMTSGIRSQIHLEPRKHSLTLANVWTVISIYFFIHKIFRENGFKIKTWKFMFYTY